MKGKELGKSLQEGNEKAEVPEEGFEIMEKIYYAKNETQLLIEIKEILEEINCQLKAIVRKIGIKEFPSNKERKLRKRIKRLEEMLNR